MTKVSVIIPCFNAEETLDRCMECLERQTIGIDNLDIIAINDFSADGTVYKLHEWERKHQNIRVFSVERRSLPGKLRNDALDMARGEYIVFLDADDWLDPEAIEKEYKTAKQYDTDILCFQYREAYDTALIDYGTSQKGRLLDLDLPHPDISRLDYLRETGIRRSCWDKMLKRGFIEENRLRFAEGLLEEESLFTIPALMQARRIYTMGESFYNYYQNPKGSTASAVRDRNHARDNENVWLQVYDRMKEDGSLEADHDIAEWFFVVNYYFYSLTLAEGRGHPYDKAGKRELAGTVKRLFPAYRDNPVLSKLDYYLTPIGGTDD